MASVALCAAPLALVEQSVAADRGLRLMVAASQLGWALWLARAASARSSAGRLQWRLFAAALLTTAIATTLDALAPIPGLAQADPGLTIGSALLLLWYPLMGLGFLEFRRALLERPRSRRDAVTLIDDSLMLIAVGVVTLTIGLVLYQGVLRFFHAGPELLVAYGFVVLDLAVFIPGVALLTGSIVRRRRGLLSPLMAAVVTRPVADVAFAVALHSGSVWAVAVAHTLWWASWGAVVPLVLHPPGVRQPRASAPGHAPGQEPGQAPGRGSPWRLVLVTGAALLIPLLVITEQLHIFRAAATIARPLLLVSVVLVFARMSLLVRELQRSLATIATLERERGDVRVGALVRHVSEAILLCDEFGTITWASPSLHRQLGHGQAWLVGRPLTDVVHGADASAVAGALVELATLGPDEVLYREFRVARDDGAWRDLQVRGTNLLGVPEVRALVLVGRDVTEEKTLQDQLRRQAYTDPLTGLANRSLFAERLDGILRLTEPSGETTPALLFIDLDDFKTVNDSVGHDIGDLLLITIAERLRGCVRPSDTVARLGGDEFAVLLADAAQGHAEKVAERIITTLADPVHIGGRLVRPSASVGIAVADDLATTSVLLRNADIAMYTAKTGGKGVAATFHADMHAQAVRRLELKSALGEALALDQLILAYQPIVELSTSAIVGVEALLRWQHPVHGLVPPLDFIPLAEESGLIVPIGRWALREACAQATVWRSTFPEFTVSVNLSGRQLTSPGLLADVRAALTDSGLPPENLVLELTETMLLTEGDVAATIAVLGDLRRLGVRLAIDDFGTGYSSLSYLQQLPVDLLKIDKSFIDDLEEYAPLGGANLLQGMLSLGESLGLRVVAEGVEHAYQHTRLRGLSCHFGQGYLFGRPMPAPDVTTILAAESVRTADVAAR